MAKPTGLEVGEIVRAISILMLLELKHRGQSIRDARKEDKGNG